MVRQSHKYGNPPTVIQQPTTQMKDTFPFHLFTFPFFQSSLAALQTHARCVHTINCCCSHHTCSRFYTAQIIIRRRKSLHSSSPPLPKLRQPYQQRNKKGGKLNQFPSQQVQTLVCFRFIQPELLSRHHTGSELRQGYQPCRHQPEQPSELRGPVQDQQDPRNRTSWGSHIP